jgi:hypothetical protein
MYTTENIPFESKVEISLLLQDFVLNKEIDPHSELRINVIHSKMTSFPDQISFRQILAKHKNYLNLRKVIRNLPYYNFGTEEAVLEYAINFPERYEFLLSVLIKTDHLPKL